MKAFNPIKESPLGIVISSNELQVSKALFPILSKLSGKTTSVKAEQYVKQNFGISFILSGIIILDKLRHL